MNQPETDRPQPALDVAAIGGWVVSTCLLFGASPVTAYWCAAYFIDGLQREREQCCQTN